MYGYGDGWAWGAWVALGFFMLVFWGLIAVLVVYAIRSTGRRPEPPAAGAPPEDQASRILDERFARGDIDVEDYTRRRDVLRAR
jgi:putative membrane protein